MKIVIAGALVAVVIVGAITWEKVAREEMRSVVAKECIEHGGKYHETMFRRRPSCKPARQ